MRWLLFVSVYYLGLQQQKWPAASFFGYITSWASHVIIVLLVYGFAWTDSLFDRTVQFKILASSPWHSGSSVKLVVPGAYVILHRWLITTNRLSSPRYVKIPSFRNFVCLFVCFAVISVHRIHTCTVNECAIVSDAGFRWWWRRRAKLARNCHLDTCHPFHLRSCGYCHHHRLTKFVHSRVSMRATKKNQRLAKH